MPRPSRRPPAPRPQTSTCRFDDDCYGRCRSIATVGGFCNFHARQLEQEAAQRTPLETIGQFLGGLFTREPPPAGRRRVAAGRHDELGQQLQEVIQAGIGLAAEHIRARTQAGATHPPAAPRASSGGSPPPGRAPRPGAGRVPPEAIAARKQNIAARGILGFEPDQPLTEEVIKGRRRDLARVWHTDNAHGQVDPTREAMMRKINAAAELLTAAARAGR